MTGDQISTVSPTKQLECRWCGSEDLRASHFRILDLFPLIVLHFPVRCRSCHVRQFIPVFRAGRFFKRQS